MSRKLGLLAVVTCVFWPAWHSYAEKPTGIAADRTIKLSPRFGRHEYQESAAMTVSSTAWVGTTTDGSLGANWSFGLPDDSERNAVLDGSSILDIATGFGAVRARGTLTGSTNFIENDEVTIATVDYTFKDTPAATANAIDVGADLETSLANLKAAINLETNGGKYGTGTVVHPTVTALSSTATALVVAAKDGGTAGNSLGTSVDGGNVGDSTWGAGTLGSGAASGATMGNVYVEPEYPGDIHTSGTKAAISCGLFQHRGSGSVYIDVVNVSRFIVDSPNFGLAAGIEMTSALSALEIIQGRTTLNAESGTALPGIILVATFNMVSEALSITADSSLTCTQLVVGPGLVTVNGGTWTSLENYVGAVTLVTGVVTSLRSTGSTVIKSTSTHGTAMIMGGALDLRQGTGGKTFTGTVWRSLSAQVLYRENIDTITLKTIGIEQP